jgi:hypothetical protein
VLRAGPLEPVLRGLLTKDPAQRATAAQAHRQLEEVLASGTAPPAWPPPQAPSGPPPPPTADGAAAARGDRVERISAEDLKALAQGSAALLSSVARDAADQARHLAERRRARRAEPTAGRSRPPQEPAPGRRPPGRRFRFRRRWVVVPVVVLVLAAVAVTAGLLALLGAAFGLF